MKKEENIHEKAIRLVEGGIVEVNGLFVRLHQEHNLYDTCYHCDMDCLCHQGNEMCAVCQECDGITGNDCLLILVTSKIAK